MRPSKWLSPAPRVSGDAGLDQDARDALQKETAAQEDRSGGESRSRKETRHDNGKADRRATLKMLPVWSDDRCLVGWISLTEAASLALSHGGTPPSFGGTA